MGARRLAQTLVAEHLLSHAQVVAALQRQTLTGGSLDTNILELELLHETTLLSAMEKAYGVGAVDKWQLDRIGAHVARLLPRAFVETYHLIPMRLYEQTLVVVGSEPPDDATTERIWNQYQLHVVAQVTIEARLRYAMQRVYGALPEPRFAQLLSTLDGFATAPAATASRQAQPAAVAEAQTQAAKPVLSAPESAPTSLAEPADAGTNSTPHPRSLLKEAILQLEAEPDRDRAMAVVIDFAHTMFDYVGVFVVHSAAPHIWRSTQSPATEHLGQIDVQLLKDSILRTIRQTRSPYLGPLPNNPDNARFLQHIARPWPKVACLTPLLVAGRLAALVYADNGDRHVSPKKVAALMTLIQRCGMAWERLIRSKKRQPRVDAGAARLMSRAPSPAAQMPRGPNAPPYVMFADITATPQQSLGDWQDVFVEVSQQDTPDPTPRLPKGTAAWRDVIAMTQAASHLMPQLDHTVHADAAHIQQLLATLDGQNVSARKSAMAQLLNLGAWGDTACQEAFPGTLVCDLWSPDAVLPPFGRCSGLCQLLVSRGHEATALVLPHLASENRTKRLMAVYFFAAVHDPGGCPALTLCLYDSEKRIRSLAIETLRHYKNDVSYAYTVQVLRQQLGTQDPSGQRFAIQTLGQLRETFAVPALIPLVAAADSEIARAAASALAVICGQAFGADVERWDLWWQSHHYQPRPAWLLAGLSHANPTIRRVAHHELQHLTGQVLDFDPQASAQEREQRAQVWQHWLQTHNLDANWHPTTVRA